MRDRPPNSLKRYILFGFVGLFFLAACKSQQPNRIAIGVISKLPESSPAYTGFRSGMADFGYVEGTDLFYIYRKVSDASQELVGNTIKELMTRDIDLLMTVEYDIALKCKELTKDNGLPILFISNPFPVEMGLSEKHRFYPGRRVGPR